MSKRGRGRGRGLDIGHPKPEADDLFAFKDEDDTEIPAPLHSRVGRNLKQFNHPSLQPRVVIKRFEQQDEGDIPSDDEYPELKKALEESKRTAATEEIIRKVGGIGKPYEEKSLSLQDVLSEDEDEEPKKMFPKQSKNTFAAVTARGSKPTLPPTGIRSGKAQGAMKLKPTANTDDLATGDPGLPPKPKLTDFFQAKKTSGPSQTGDKSSGVKTRNGRKNFDASSTKPKIKSETVAEAAGGSSTSPKTITQQVEIGVDSDVEPPRAVAKESNMRFNPFTNRMEPKPNYKPLCRPIVKTTNLVRVILPHDLEFDSAGRALTTPAEKARAWSEMMDAENRKIHEHNLHVTTLPSQTVTYREGDILGSKGRNLKGDTDLCEWWDTFFEGGLDEKEKEWIAEHQAHMTQIEEAKKAEAMGEQDE